MWIILICSTTKIRSRCPFEKKNFKMFVSNVDRLLCWEFAIISALTICPHALTICSNALTDCSYDLTVDSKQLTVGPSNVWLWRSLWINIVLRANRSQFSTGYLCDIIVRRCSMRFPTKKSLLSPTPRVHADHFALPGKSVRTDVRWRHNQSFSDG